MKKTIRVLAIYATLGLMAPFAQVTQLQAQTPAPAAAQGGQCTDETKAAWYADFTKYRTTDPTKAYEAAKQYLGACPAEEGAIPTYLKKWVVAYDKENRKFRLNDLFARQGKYAEAIPLAKEVLADEPDSVNPLIVIGYGGYVLAARANNTSGNAEALDYTKKAIHAIESGKAPESWTPFKSKDDALGYLYYSLGYLQQTTNPTESLANFIKAAQFDGDIKKGSPTYAIIANAYENEYAKQSADYSTKFKDKPETPESKLAAENINQIVDRIIDALARAVAVAGTDAKAQAAKTQWLARLTELYKFRKGSDAGLNEMIASVMSKPLPPVPTPITTLPPSPTTTTTPATGVMSDTGSTSAPGAVNKTTAPAAAASLTTAPKTTATPPATTTSTKAPVKPKTRNNHRRH